MAAQWDRERRKDEKTWCAKSRDGRAAVQAAALGR
jgi:hypothetical protein